MAGSHVAHDCVLGDRVILANSALIGGHCRIGDNVFLGGGAVVHQFVRIGRLSLCKGNSATVQSLPPFVLADGTHGIMGLNTVGLRRAGISPHARASIKAAVALAFRSGLNLSQALEEAEKRTWEPEAAEFFAFLKDPGKRGVSGFLRRSRKSLPDEDA
jgi:UDP-N-acetylglucosamine acyltransferase